MRALCLVCLAWLSTVGSAMGEDDSFPRTLPDGDMLQALMLEWPEMIGMFRMALQKRDGGLTEGPGVVPLLSDGGGRHRFAFYEPVPGGYRLVGDPVVFDDTARPRVEKLTELGVEAIQARRVDGNGEMVAYVLRGTVMVEGR